MILDYFWKKNHHCFCEKWFWVKFIINLQSRDFYNFFFSRNPFTITKKLKIFKISKLGNNFDFSCNLLFTEWNSRWFRKVSRFLNENSWEWIKNENSWSWAPEKKKNLARCWFSFRPEFRKMSVSQLPCILL